MALAATLAWYCCSLLLHGSPPVFAGIAAVMVIQPNVLASARRAFERSLGVLVGVVVAELTALVLPAGDVASSITILLAVASGWLLRLPATAAVQAPISAMLVIAFNTTIPGYAGLRIVETIIGALIGVAANLIPVSALRRRAAPNAPRLYELIEGSR